MQYPKLNLREIIYLF